MSEIEVWTVAGHLESKLTESRGFRGAEVVLHADHLAAVEQARRAAFGEALEMWHKPFCTTYHEDGTVKAHSYMDYLRAQAGEAT